MNKYDHKISQKNVIKQLDETVINKIAAGEVVERPASAVKELIENSIDAGCSDITIEVADGGKTLIRVIDDGLGMSDIDLPIALRRHATSKLPNNNLLNINSFGFRGEALPSLGAVGRLRIISHNDGNGAHEINVNGGKISDIKPAARTLGTTIELRDLFYATPARLKFLRSTKSELKAITDIVKGLSISTPNVAFTLIDKTGGKSRKIIQVQKEKDVSLASIKNRLSRVLGQDFSKNSISIDVTREDVNLTGYVCLPTYARASNAMQYFFVNNRQVRDKQLIGALRAAYSDFMPRDRFPAAAIYINCRPDFVDVNVHPGKSEVRFRDPQGIRSLIVTGIRQVIAIEGHRSSSTLSTAALGAMREQTRQIPNATDEQVTKNSQNMDDSGNKRFFTRDVEPAFQETWKPSARDFQTKDEHAKFIEEFESFPLGAPIAQFGENYIISQNDDGIVIIDQHAAHERLVYEKLKEQVKDNKIEVQALLVPEILELSEPEILVLIEYKDNLSMYGLKINQFGINSIAVQEIPAILNSENIKKLIFDILDELTDLENSDTLEKKINAVLSRIACHGSIRSGRMLRTEEMNSLLREMENTPNSGQCNHGRPTHISIKMSDIERLFGRR
ncbi:MAG: DNA mismatch repair endonuclease MutL [Paracoccaceae bacterium]|uniref:DNA mismatch repair endonuclease MutL n=1 Tax=Candidatus Salinivivens marinus TaxID=3381703 RepID=UPI000BE0626A|nr:MAG: DNA mismatch repair endonuclease MutL [Rhodobacteraceae bacterium MED-G08]